MLTEIKQTARSFPGWILVWLLLLGGGIGLGAWLWPRPSRPAVVVSHPPPPDPRLSYTGPLENIHPSVGYVGDKTCAHCHPTIARTYAKHPMARTLVPAEKTLAGRPRDRAHHLPFTALGMLLDTHQEGKQWWHRASRTDNAGKPVVSLDLPVHYAIGSGVHGSSYLSVRGPFVFQTLISWYSQKQIWDVSPIVFHQMTKRSVSADCLFCHANRVEPIAGSVNRYAEPVFRGHGIGCERCHGPGEAHVQKREKGEPLDDEGDNSIVHPGRLSWQLRNNICEQCHLQGASRERRRGRGVFDWRPGLPLEQFLSIHVEADAPSDPSQANGQVEQMYQSRCFQKSRADKKLGCVSCHDPHVWISREHRAEHYRNRCLECHQKKGCAIHLAERWRLSPGDSCIDCHMPQLTTTNVAHTALTDHRIHRRPAASVAGRSSGQLINFYQDRLGRDDPEVRRDLGIALGNHLLKKGPTVRRETGQAIEILNEALRRAPEDVDARAMLGDLKSAAGQFKEALVEYGKVLEAEPTREQTLLQAALAAVKIGHSLATREYVARLARLNPELEIHAQWWSELLLQDGEVEESLTWTRTWLRLNPTSIAARVQLFHLLLRTGRKAEAQRELDVLRRLGVSNWKDLEQEFARMR
jgi:tetratricopeptide (TPR) repeat protein